MRTMGEGVSLALNRQGVSGDNHFPSVISVSFTRKHVSRVGYAPFLREYIYYGGCFLLVSRSANEAGIDEVGSVRRNLGYSEAVHAQASRIDGITPWIRDMGLQGGGLYQKWVSPSPQKGKGEVFFLPSWIRWVATAGTDLPKKEANRTLSTIVISVIQLLGMLEFREEIDACAWVHKWLDVAVGTTHRADPQVTSLSEFVPGKSRREGWSFIIGRGFGELVGSVSVGDESAAAKCAALQHKIADNGDLLPVGQGNAGYGFAGGNVASKAISWGLYSYFQGLGQPNSDLLQSVDEARPKKSLMAGPLEGTNNGRSVGTASAMGSSGKATEILFDPLIQSVRTGEQKGVVELDFQPVRAVSAANGSRDLKIGNITDVVAVNAVANVVGGTVSGIGSLHLELLAVGFGMKLNLGLPMGPRDSIGRPSSSWTFIVTDAIALKHEFSVNDDILPMCGLMLSPLIAWIWSTSSWPLAVRPAGRNREAQISLYSVSMGFIHSRDLDVHSGCFRTMKRVLKARLGAGNISCRRCRFFL